MVKFQLEKRRNGREVGKVTIPLDTWRQLGWNKKTRLSIINGIEPGTLIIKEVKQ